MNQPDTITAYFNFLNRSEVGPAIFIVEHAKIGRGTSVLHISLFQHDLLTQAPWIKVGSSPKEIVAYVTNTSFKLETGLSLPTGYSLQPAPPPVDLVQLKKGTDENWQQMKTTATEYRKAMMNMVYNIPREGNPMKSVVDCWVRLASGENFTNVMLGYVADCYPYIVESWRPPPPSRKSTGGSDAVADAPFAWNAEFWYPTLVLNLDVKKALPEAGTEWLFIRVQAKEIKNGRLDLEVVILDREGELVALSQHVNMIVGSERNMAKRNHTKGKM
jgi:hypothetical protein